jgi:CheY-like chemotaxis protein
VSLRILFADDSVTAQNMGKKILTEAGYEVVAVSNGAAAVKKIAEQKPDIIILDVYMPGYSGLEVCEKVRSSMATIKTPVLLTVGKMEPYKPEEANRVRADGVIIKPFEASDLLAIIKKFEERIGNAPVAAEPVKAAVEQPVEEIVIQPPARTEPAARVSKAMVEVPDHMAPSSAFSDLLGTDATRMDPFVMPPVTEAAPLPQPEQSSANIPAPHHEPVVRDGQGPDQPTAETSAEPDTVKIPAYQEAEPSHYEVVPTAAAPIGDIEIPREAALQESAEQTTRNTIADVREPDLLPTAHQVAEPEQMGAIEVLPIGVQTASAAMAEAGEAAEAARQKTMAASGEVDHVDPEPAAAPSLAEADFEARVAAAMAAYGQVAASGPAAAAIGETPEASAISTHQSPAPIVEETSPREAAAGAAGYQQYGAAAADGAGVPETSAFGNVPVSLAPETAAAPEKVEAQAAGAGAGSDHASIVASVEAELAGAARSVAQPASPDQGEHDNIAQAVHRVMERMKENLVEEIVRELKGKK